MEKRCEKMELTLEKVKEIIIDYANENKIYPIARQLLKDRKDLHKSYSTYVKYYGVSIMDIIKSCNLPYEFQEKTDKYTDEVLIHMYKEISSKIKKTASCSDIDEYRKTNKEIPSSPTFRDRFGSIEKLAEICGLFKIMDGQKFNAQHLTNEIRRFNIEYGRLPTQKDFEKPPQGYPSRKSFANNFGSFNNALRAAGFEVKDKPEYNKEYLLSEIQRYIDEFGKQPFCHDMDATKGYPAKSVFMKVFGSWNNAIKESGLKIRVSNYTDKELDNAFFSFVDEYGRPPIFLEFNNNAKYPSFWCYQNRFGSWNKTLLHYGFDVNKGVSGSHTTFKNGEVCKSTYEFDVSTWLRDNNISYLRNVLYRDFIEEYDGKKDCDYVIIHNGEWIFLEIAGLYTFKEKKSSMEKDYIERFDHKLKNLLSKFNYKVLYPDDFKKINYKETFAFLNEIEHRPWFEGEPIYRGMPDEFDEVV